MNILPFSAIWFDHIWNTLEKHGLLPGVTIGLFNLTTALIAIAGVIFTLRWNRRKHFEDLQWARTKHEEDLKHSLQKHKESAELDARKEVFLNYVDSVSEVASFITSFPADDVETKTGVEAMKRFGMATAQLHAFAGQGTLAAIFDLQEFISIAWLEAVDWKRFLAGKIKERDAAIAARDRHEQRAAEIARDFTDPALRKRWEYHREQAETADGYARQLDVSLPGTRVLATDAAQKLNATMFTHLGKLILVARREMQFDVDETWYEGRRQKLFSESRKAADAFRKKWEQELRN